MADVTHDDWAFFEANRTKMDYVRAPQPGEFTDIEIPEGSRVHVYLINRRSLVKALELPTGERIATVMELEPQAAAKRRAA
ncbi:hypothetical protein [Kallotenue papyrolyticum]|uniref:hypothetical protein n=1 Tax=Kallotenue papyrolyticum TaxID=1325125 RepID=UPI0004785870|nr:hypothetical protein [Kallotenue papyrolyticum]